MCRHTCLQQLQKPRPMLDGQSVRDEYGCHLSVAVANVQRLTCTWDVLWVDTYVTYDMWVVILHIAYIASLTTGMCGQTCGLLYLKCKCYVTKAVVASLHVLQTATMHV